jgi:hypothetical protein
MAFGENEMVFGKSEAMLWLCKRKKSGKKTGFLRSKYGRIKALLAEKIV